MTDGQTNLICAGGQCRQENGSVHNPPGRTSFGPQNTSQSFRVENPIMERTLERILVEILTFGPLKVFQIGTQLVHRNRLILTILMVVHMSGLVDY